MKKTRSLIIYTLATFLITLHSCKEGFIKDVTAPDRIPVNGYYTSQANFQSALTGIYGTLRSRYDVFWKMAEVPSDNTMTNGTVDADIGNLDRLSWNNSEPVLLSTWQGSYTTIAHCNIFLDKIAGFEMDNNLKDRWIGEVKFIRALMYFDLVRFFGPVPLVLKPVLTDEEAYSYSRESVNNIYAQLILDLKDAEVVLPKNYAASNDAVRVTSGAAKALLGKIYLTKKDYGLAATKLREIISPNNNGFSYALLNTYADVFSTSNENNAEIIFSVQYSKGIYNEGSNFTRYFFPNKSTELTNVSPIGNNQGTPNLFNSFESNDKRKSVSIISFGSGASQTYYTRKFVDQPLAANQGENNWILLRYADVLLMEAEAMNEMDDPKAVDYLNEVRKRAGLPERSFTTKEDLRNQILKERRLEFCFEGQRWFDLVRTNTMVSALTAQFTSDNFNYLGNINASRTIFPVPFREVTLNPNLN